jgi:membrane protease subunit HflC
MPSRLLRLLAAVGVVLLCALWACTVAVGEAQAVVITRLGEPVRTLTRPGLAWLLPPPIERSVAVDLRLRTTASGLYAAQLADGATVVVEAFAAWRVARTPDAALAFLRAVRNDADEAGAQLRGMLGSAVQTASAGFRLDELVNTDPARLRLAAFETALTTALAEKAGTRYGIEVIEVGLERLALPEPIVASTITAMIEDRKVLAQRLRSEGSERAGQIVSAANAEARRLVAEARVEASRLEAEARREAAAIHAAVHDRDPRLYRLMRGLAGLRRMLGADGTVVLRSDAWPLRLLVEGPERGSDAP